MSPEVITAIGPDSVSPSKEAIGRPEGAGSPPASGNSKRGITMQDRFKIAFARDVKVHFVGVWDTVSSVGLVRGKALPGTASGMSHVCYFRHALALDEQRVKFLPEFVRGGLGPDVGAQDTRTSDKIMPEGEAPSNALSSAASFKFGPDVKPSPPALYGNAIGSEHTGSGNTGAPPMSQSVQQAVQDASETTPHTKEVWFPGSHSDIGGGAILNEEMQEFGPALRWMSFEARIQGLEITNEPHRWKTELKMTIPLNPFWNLLECIPIKRLTYDNDCGTTHWPHFWAHRKCHPGQRVYDGVSPETKESLKKAGLEVERDPYSDIEQLLTALKNRVALRSLLSATERASLRVLRDAALGQQQLLDLNNHDSANENVSTLLTQMLVICQENFTEPHSADLANDIQLLLYGLEYSFDMMHNSRPLHEVLGISLAEGLRMCPKPLRRHHGAIMTLGCLNDARRIVSGSWDGTINVWDAFTGQPIGEPIWDAIGCGAVVPNGKVLIGEYGPPLGGGAVKVWDLETGAKILGPWYESGIDGISCVAYSPNCERIAYASEAGIIVRDASTSRLIRHSYAQGIWIPTMTFSPDSHCLAVGFSDGRIVILPLDSPGVAAELPLIGHDQPVRAVAYSPNNKLLVSGSEDGSIRVWSTDTREVLHVMTGHSSSVLCVAFSPVGKYIASGSRDHSVRIWNSETGRPVGVPLKGHTDVVRRVTFTSDGVRVISGSNDCTIRIWDRMPTVLIDDGDAARQSSYPAPALPLQPQPSVSADGAAPDPPSGADPTLPTAAGDAPQPADQSSPPIADHPAQSGASDALPEPGQEPRATVATVPGFEGREGHCDDPAQTAHVEASSAAAQGEVEAVAEGAEAGDAVAQGTVTVSTVGFSLEDAKGPVPPSEGAASSRAGNDAQLADQSSQTVADRPTQSGAADAPPEPEQEPLDKVSGSDDPDTHGEVHPQSPQGDAAHVEGDSEAGNTVAQGTTATVAPSSEDAKGPVAPPDAAAPASPSAAQTTLLAAAGDKPDGQLAEDQQTAPPFADAAHAPEPVQEPHATAGEVPGSEGPGGHGEGRPQTAHIEAAGAGDAGEAEAALDAATASVTATVEHSLEYEKGRLG